VILREKGDKNRGKRMLRAVHARLRTPTSSYPWRPGNEITENPSIILREKRLFDADDRFFSRHEVA
jgi:hypothetical protein